MNYYTIKAICFPAKQFSTFDSGLTLVTINSQYHVCYTHIFIVLLKFPQEFYVISSCFPELTENVVGNKTSFTVYVLTTVPHSCSYLNQ